MTLADIELANLDIKPFFENQAINSIDVLYNIYPGIRVYPYVLNVKGNFTLKDLPTNKGQMAKTISPELSVFVIIQSQEEFCSHLILNREHEEIFNGSVPENSEKSIISPIGYENSLVGFLLTIIPQEQDASEINMKIFDKTAMGIGSTFVATELLDKFKKRSDHLSVMLEVNTHLNIAATKEDYLTEISRFGKYFIQFDRAVLVLHAEDTPEYFTIDFIEGDQGGLQLGMSYPVYNSLVSRAISTGQYFIYKKSRDEFPEGIYRAGDCIDHPYAQVVGFPLERVNNSSGVLVLESKDEHPIKQSEISIFEMISQSLGAALNRFRLYERLTNYATIDTLTHLYNLRALKQRFEEELARAGRYQNSLVVLFLDIDKFKQVNDTHGHLTGDYVLRETAQIIRETIRTSDIPGRYGGEEFVVIMVNADAKSCLASAQRICSAIHDHKFEMNEVSIRSKISIGLAEFPKDGETMQELIQSADTAMYTAKGQGGNQVVQYEKRMVPKSEA